MQGFFIVYSALMAAMLIVGTSLAIIYVLLRKKFRTYETKIANGGYGAARAFLNNQKLFDIKTIRARGGKRNYYEKNKKLLFLSEESYSLSSVYAVSKAYLAAAEAVLLKKGTSSLGLHTLIPSVEYLLKFVMPLSAIGLTFGFCRLFIPFATTCIIFSLIIITSALVFSAFILLQKRAATKLILTYLKSYPIEISKNNLANPDKIKRSNFEIDKIKRNNPESNKTKRNNLENEKHESKKSKTPTLKNDIMKAAIQKQPPLFLINTLLSPVFYLISLIKLFVKA